LVVNLKLAIEQKQQMPKDVRAEHDALATAVDNINSLLKRTEDNPIPAKLWLDAGDVAISLWSIERKYPDIFPRSNERIQEAIFCYSKVTPNNSILFSEANGKISILSPHMNAIAASFGENTIMVEAEPLRGQEFGTTLKEKLDDLVKFFSKLLGKNPSE